MFALLLELASLHSFKMSKGHITTTHTATQTVKTR